METRTCTKCGETKPASEFYLRDDPKRKQQSFAVCKPCILKQNTEYREKHLSLRNEIERESKRRIMIRALEKLSPNGDIKCVICGFNEDFRLLQIDHINNNGSQDKAKSGHKRTGNRLQAKILLMTDEEARKEYQVLCIIHNWLKRYGDRGENYRIIKKD